jgi:hypothetical protein
METASFIPNRADTPERRHHRFWRRHPIISGALGGLVWGALMRLWMRFISTDPEFSWSGTGFILGAALLAGLGLGTAFFFSRRSTAGWWRLLGLPVILLGMGAGMLMLPGVILGGLAFGRRDWPKAIRLVLGVIAIGGTVALIGLTGEDDFGLVKTVAALVLFAAFHTIEMAATSIAFAPARAKSAKSEAPGVLGRV